MINAEMLTTISENKHLLSEKKIKKFIANVLNLNPSEFNNRVKKHEILNLTNLSKSEQDSFITQSLITAKQTLIEGIFIPITLVYDLVYPEEMLNEELITSLKTKHESSPFGVFASIKLHENYVELLIYSQQNNLRSSYIISETKNMKENNMNVVPLSSIKSYKRVQISYNRFLDILLDKYSSYLANPTQIKQTPQNFNLTQNFNLNRNSSMQKIKENDELAKILNMKFTDDRETITSIKFIPHTKELVVRYNEVNTIKQVDFLLGTSPISAPKFEFHHKIDNLESFGYRIDTNLCILVSVLPSQRISSVEVRRITKPISVLNPTYNVELDTVREENMSQFLTKYIAEINNRIKLNGLVDMDLFDVLYRKYLLSLDKRSKEYKHYLTNVTLYSTEN